MKNLHLSQIGCLYLPGQARRNMHARPHAEWVGVLTNWAVQSYGVGVEPNFARFPKLQDDRRIDCSWNKWNEQRLLE